MIEPPPVPVGRRVVAVGVDVVEIDRIRAARRRTARFDDRVLSDHERREAARAHDGNAWCAACFGAKEAVAKALGVGLSGIGMRAVSLRLVDGVHAVTLDGRAAVTASTMGIAGWSVRVATAPGPDASHVVVAVAAWA